MYVCVFTYVSTYSSTYACAHTFLAGIARGSAEITIAIVTFIIIVCCCCWTALYFNRKSRRPPADANVPAGANADVVPQVGAVADAPQASPGWSLVRAVTDVPQARPVAIPSQNSIENIPTAAETGIVEAALTLPTMDMDAIPVAVAQPV